MHGYEPTREDVMAAFREELAKGIGKSAFGGKADKVQAGRFVRF